MATNPKNYPATLSIDYPKKLDRLTSFFRIFWAVPILVILAALQATAENTYINEDGEEMSRSIGGIAIGLAIAIALMIIFRQRYPRWWFDFYLQLTRFSTRVGAYLLLLTDKYPSTVETQSVHLEVEYPDVEKDLNRYMPLVKWFLAIPHYVALLFLAIGAIVVTVIAWFAILFTGRYPENLFNFVVGVLRWELRVSAYMALLTTDEYPPFTLK